MLHGLVNGLPVSMLSLTIQLPVMRTASHCMIHPPRGISSTSPGTRSSDGRSIYSIYTDGRSIYSIQTAGQYTLYTVYIEYIDLTCVYLYTDGT